MCKEREEQFMLGVEVRFRGRLLTTYIDEGGCMTLYRVGEDRYFVYVEDLPEDDEDEGLAWLERGHVGSGMSAAEVLNMFREFEVAIARAERGVSRATSTTSAPSCS